MQTAIIVATFVVTTFAPTPPPPCTSNSYYGNIGFIGANKKPYSTPANIVSLRAFLDDNNYCLGECIPGGPLAKITEKQKKKSCKDVGFRLSGSQPPVKYDRTKYNPHQPALTACHWSGPTEKQSGVSSIFRRDKTKRRTHRGFRSQCRRPKTAEVLADIGHNHFNGAYECTDGGLQGKSHCYTTCRPNTPIACNHYDKVGFWTHADHVPSEVRPCRYNQNGQSYLGYSVLCDRTTTRVVTPAPSAAPVVPHQPLLEREQSTKLAKNEYVNQYKGGFLEEENELQNERSYVFAYILGTSMVLSCCICGLLIFGLTCGMMAAEVMRRRGFCSKTEEIQEN